MEFNRYKLHTLENNVVYESLDIAKEIIKLNQLRSIFFVGSLKCES